MCPLRTQGLLPGLSPPGRTSREPAFPRAGAKGSRQHPSSLGSGHQVVETSPERSTLALRAEGPQSERQLFLKGDVSHRGRVPQRHSAAPTTGGRGESPARPGPPRPSSCRESPSWPPYGLLGRPSRLARLRDPADVNGWARHTFHPSGKKKTNQNPNLQPPAPTLRAGETPSLAHPRSASPTPPTPSKTAPGR